MVNENQIQSEGKMPADEQRLQHAYEGLHHRRELVELLAALTPEQVRAVSDLVDILLMTSDIDERRLLLTQWFYSLSPLLQTEVSTALDKMSK